MTGVERVVNRPTRAATAYGLVPVLALAATVAIESGERQSLAQAVEGIQSQFGVSDAAIGALPAAMVAVGVLGSVPIGILADRIRRTGLLGTAMAMWTGGMALSALAPGYATLFAARLSVGSVEGNGPAAVSLIADYYPVRHRARIFGLYQSGALLGALVGLVAGGFVVESHGWRWAFWMWVPVGVAVAVWMWLLPEPTRGAQDSDLGLTDGAGAVSAVEVSSGSDRLELPAPERVGTLDYRRATLREVVGELRRIRSLWLAVLALSLSQFLLLGLQFWGVEFFKRAHDLSAGKAGIFTGLFGLGAAVGVVGGGFLSDRFLRRGVVNARIHVIAGASLAAPFALVPAFLIPNLAATTPFFVLGGLLLTLPIAPGEAMMNDVVVAPLRGRAGSVRSVLRSAAALSPLAIGALSDAIGLRAALAVVTPLYAVGGLLMLLAIRSYGADLAFVAAETNRIRAAAEDDGPPDEEMSTDHGTA